MLDALARRFVAAGAVGVIATRRAGDTVSPVAAGRAALSPDAGLPDVDGHFRIGSVTKPFTAALALRHLHRDVDRPVTRWLPEVGDDRITLRHLLTHRSGLHNYTDDVTDVLAGRFARWSAWDLVAPALSRPRNFAPGAGRSYCNTGYLIVGLVVERVTGRSWADELTAAVIEPLGLRDTHLGRVHLPTPHARGYLTVEGRQPPVDVTDFDPSQAGAAGSIVSSLADVDRFFRALLRGEVLPPDALAAMRSGGLGLGRKETAAGPVYGYDGGFFGFQTRSWHSPDGERQVTVSATTTTAGAGGLPPTDLLVPLLAPASTETR